MEVSITLWTVTVVLPSNWNGIRNFGGYIESLISLLKGYQLTGDERCLEWFEKVHDYTWTHFKDPEYPEWFGYLNRQGEVLLPLKGGEMERMFPCTKGIVPMLESTGKFINPYLNRTIWTDDVIF